ncbi:hypothetical protein GCM10023347_47520 [Streptomyces chumphonensis]
MRSPHSRQDSATAGPRETPGCVESDAVVLATVFTAMEARPFLLIFPATAFAAGRNWHLPHGGFAPE